MRGGVSASRRSKKGRWRGGRYHQRADPMRPRSSPSPDYLHPLSRALALAFRRRRLEAKVSIKKAAGGAKLARSAVAKLERGDSWFSVNVLMRLCEAAGLDADAVWREAWRRCRRRRRSGVAL